MALVTVPESDAALLQAWRAICTEPSEVLKWEPGRRTRAIELATKASPWVEKSIDGIRRSQAAQERARAYGEPEGDAPPDAQILNGAPAPNGHDVIRATKRHNVIDWSELHNKQPPQFVWLWEHWLSFHAQGIWGRGGVGKSLLAQQIETACAIGRPLWGQSQGPLPVLAWHCEDDRDEIWRRQDRICRSMKIGFDALNNLHIDARCGLENALFTTEYGRPMWTPLYAELEEQVNDYKANVLVLDNIAQIFGGNLNDQHHVTTFVNGIIGLVRDRPFCPIFLGHVAKVQGSEFSGAMAWENSIRLRMLFTEKLPDETGADPFDSGTEASETRFLCKRKANYTKADYVQFRYDDGVFVIAGDGPSEGGMMDHLRAARARTITLAAVRKLTDMGFVLQPEPGKGFLPAKIVEMKLADGYTKIELRNAMNALIGDGSLIRAEVGYYSNRAPRFGLKVVN